MTATHEVFEHYRYAHTQLVTEAVAAQKKHGQDFENAGVDKKLRIMTEEVGEIASAIQDLEEAHKLWGKAWDLANDQNREVSATELESLAGAIAAAEQHLLDEVAQVGACCLRWIAGIR